MNCGDATHFHPANLCRQSSLSWLAVPHHNSFANCSSSLSLQSSRKCLDVVRIWEWSEPGNKVGGKPLTIINSSTKRIINAATVDNGIFGEILRCVPALHCLRVCTRELYDGNSCVIVCKIAYFETEWLKMGDQVYVAACSSAHG